MSELMECVKYFISFFSCSQDLHMPQDSGFSLSFLLRLIKIFYNLFVGSAFSRNRMALGLRNRLMNS
jgi:hypothetical protein